MYIPPILLYNIFPEEQFVGYLNVVFLSLSIISSYLISRTANSESTVKYLFISAFGFIFSSVFLLSEISIWTVVLFMSISSVFKPLQANAYAVYYFRWVDMLPLKENFRVESVVLRESIINLGRGTGIIIFMFFSNEINPVTIPWIIISVMAVQLLIPYLAKERPNHLKVNLHSSS
jgi:YQGE family putative transporter